MLNSFFTINRIFAKNHICFRDVKTSVKLVNLLSVRQCASNAPPEKRSLFKRFKLMYRDYWYVLIPVHLLTSSCWSAGFYYMAVSGVNVVPLLERVGVSERFTSHLKDSKMGYFAVAYALYKLATPVRYMTTLGGTTVAINYLKHWGYIKPANQIIGKTKKRIQVNAEKIIKEFKDKA